MYWGSFGFFGVKRRIYTSTYNMFVVYIILTSFLSIHLELQEYIKYMYRIY